MSDRALPAAVGLRSTCQIVSKCDTSALLVWVGGGRLITTAELMTTATAIMIVRNETYDKTNKLKVNACNH